MKPLKMKIRVHSRMYNDETATMIVTMRLRNAYVKNAGKIYYKRNIIYVEFNEEILEEEIIGLKETIAEESETLARLEFLRIE